jgi:predicted DNA binding CopG/RHH family protein
VIEAIRVYIRQQASMETAALLMFRYRRKRKPMAPVLTNGCTEIHTPRKDASIHGAIGCAGRQSNTMKKKLPRFRSDKGAEDFVDNADLAEYDLSAMRPTRFEFQTKGERINMRVPRELLDAVRASASKAGMPYQRFIRQVLEEAVRRRRA